MYQNRITLNETITTPTPQQNHLKLTHQQLITHKVIQTNNCMLQKDDESFSVTLYKNNVL